MLLVYFLLGSINRLNCPSLLKLPRVPQRGKACQGRGLRRARPGPCLRPGRASACWLYLHAAGSTEGPGGVFRGAMCDEQSWDQAIAVHPRGVAGMLIGAYRLLRAFLWTAEREVGCTSHCFQTPSLWKVKKVLKETKMVQFHHNPCKNGQAIV